MIDSDFHLFEHAVKQANPSIGASSRPKSLGKARQCWGLLVFASDATRCDDANCGYFNCSVTLTAPALSWRMTRSTLPPFGAITTHSIFARSAVGVESVQKLINVCL